MALCFTRVLLGLTHATNEDMVFFLCCSVYMVKAKCDKLITGKAVMLTKPHSQKCVCVLYVYDEFIFAITFMLMQLKGSNQWRHLGVNSRLSCRGVLWYGDGEGGIGELWRSGSGNYREDGRGTAAAQPVCSHNCQQVLSVPLQRKACSPHLTVFLVYFKTTITPCEKQYAHWKNSAKRFAMPVCVKLLLYVPENLWYYGSVPPFLILLLSRQY